MFKRIPRGFFIIVAVLLIIVFSFILNEWLCITMPRHQLIQLPAMILTGLLIYLSYSKFHIPDFSIALSALIFIMATLTFWMLPRSIDFAVIYPYFNRLMHANMIIAGFLLIPSLKKVIFEIRILFFFMTAAMLMATGVTLRVFKILLCSSFNIEQQKETGFYLLIISSLIMLITLINFFRFPLKNKSNNTITKGTNNKEIRPTNLNFAH